MPDGTLIQVVGIVEDGKYTANLAEDPQPAMFLPVAQFPASDTCLVVRSGRDPQLAGVVLAVALLGLVATWIPAQRALSVNPMILLRED